MRFDALGIQKKGYELVKQNIGRSLVFSSEASSVMKDAHYGHLHMARRVDRMRWSGGPVRGERSPQMRMNVATLRVRGSRRAEGFAGHLRIFRFLQLMTKPALLPGYKRNLLRRHESRLPHWVNLYKKKKKAKNDTNGASAWMEVGSGRLWKQKQKKVQIINIAAVSL